MTALAVRFRGRSPETTKCVARRCRHLFSMYLNELLARACRARRGVVLLAQAACACLPNGGYTISRIGSSTALCMCAAAQVRAVARPDQAHAAWKHVRFHFTALRSDSPVAAGAMAVGETNAQDAADGTSAHERKPARGHGSAPPPTVGPGSDESIFEYHERLPCVQSDPRRRRWRRAPICFETRRK